MTPCYLLDTNVLSEPLKAAPNAGVMRAIKKHRSTIATAAPVWHELVFGCRRLPASRQRTALEEYLYQALAPSLVILPYDSKAAERHGWERARLSLLGKTPAFVDGQIAAVAQTNDLILVTRNVSDFTVFEDLDLEDWTV